VGEEGEGGLRKHISLGKNRRGGGGFIHQVLCHDCPKICTEIALIEAEELRKAGIDHCRNAVGIFGKRGAREWTEKRRGGKSLCGAS